MPYLVLEAKKKGTQNGREYSFAPHGWLDQVNKIVYWPKSGMITKRKYEENSVFELNWIPQPIIKIRHTDLTFDEADELAEHYYKRTTETETDDSEWEKKPFSRPERAKKRLMPQMASLPRNTQYSLSLSNSLPESSNNVYSLNDDIEDDGDGGLQGYSIINQADGTSVLVSSQNLSPPTKESVINIQHIPDELPTNYQCISSDQFSTLCQSVNQMRSEIDELKVITKGFGEVLSQILSKTSNVDKDITDYLKKADESISRGLNELAPKELAKEEDFSNLESKKKLKSTEDLQEFEQLLQDKCYQDRFIRFLRTKFKMNSHENGQTFFTMVIRLLTEPTLFLPYSWKGLNRKDSQNISFEGKHNIFITFICRIVRMADQTKVQTDVEKMFENLLRFKKVNNVREICRTKPAKKPSSRSRPKAMQYKYAGEADEVIVDDEGEEESH